MRYLLLNQESDRLRYRLLNENDFDIWLDFFYEEGIEQLIGMEDIPTPELRNREWFNKVESRYNSETGGLNALIDKETGEFIGQCGLLVQELDGVNEMEIGYSILKKYRNKGYASEASQKCRDYAFEKGFAEHLISIIHEDNTTSKKVALNNGMKLWKKTTFWGMNVEVYKITQKEWNSLTTSHVKGIS
jgi:RimJ/RimL family protein N-acetyltransferase